MICDSAEMLEDTLLLFTQRVRADPRSRSRARCAGDWPRPQTVRVQRLAGRAGLKHGIAYGTTDDIGWKAVENRTHWHDFHATVLHLLGIDHTRLT